MHVGMQLNQAKSRAYKLSQYIQSHDIFYLLMGIPDYIQRFVSF